MFDFEEIFDSEFICFYDAEVLRMPSVYDVGAALLVCVSVCMVDSSNSSSVGGAIVVDDVDGGDDD